MRVLGEQFVQQIGQPRHAAAVAPGSTLLNNLVAFWKLDEASGVRVDATGRGNHLADNNGVARVAGKVGNAAGFNGVDQYLSRASNADLQIDGSFSLAGWFKGNSVSHLVAKGTSPPEYRFFIGDDGLAWTIIDDLGAEYSAIAGAVDNNWHFFVAWHDADLNQVGLAFDGGAPITAACGVPRALTGDFNLSYELDPYLGTLDAIGIWKRVLTSDERAELWNSGAGKEYPFA